MKKMSRRASIPEPISNTPVRMTPEGDVVVQTLGLNMESREQIVARFDRLFHKKAWETWNRLPPPLRVLIDPEDFYQESYLEAIRCFDKWKPEKASFSTFVFTAVTNRMNSLLTYWTCKKRFSIYQADIENVDLEASSSSIPDLISDPVLRALVESPT